MVPKSLLSKLEMQTDKMIYTDWANHYLGKAGGEEGEEPRLILDLQKDMSDPALLVQVIQAVTGERVPGLQFSPRDASQQVANIEACLSFARSLGVSVEDVSGSEIAGGQLKAILGLFFSLSRYKQECKAKAAPSPSHSALRQPQQPTLASRIAQPDRAMSLKSGRPSGLQPPSSGLRGPSPAPDKPSPAKGLKPPGKGLPVPAKSKGIPAPSKPAPKTIAAPSPRTASPNTAGNANMLEKFKLFNSPRKTAAKTATNSSKISASSSGFSSASRSEASEGSGSREEVADTSTFRKTTKTALKPPKAAKVPKVPNGKETVPAKGPGSSRKEEAGTDGDSAYGPDDSLSSTSPSSSIPESRFGAASPAGKSEDGSKSERRSGLKAPNVTSPTSSSKPTMAVKALNAGKGLRAPTKTSVATSASIPKPPSKLRPSTSTAEIRPPASIPSVPEAMKPVRSASSAGFKGPKSAVEETPSTSTAVATGSPTVGVVSPMTHHRASPPQKSPPNAYDLGYDTAEERGDAVRKEPGSKSTKKKLVEASAPKLETTFGAPSIPETLPERRESGSSDDGGLEAMQPLVPRAALFGASRLHGLRRVAEPGEAEGAGEAPGEAVGYASESDRVAFTGPLADLSTGDLGQGYNSEGGIPMYAQKMEAVFREGLQAVRESLRKPDPLNDSFEDSSSISSGLSENLDEISTDDLTASSGQETGFGKGIGAGNAKVQATQRQILQLQQQKKDLRLQQAGLKGGGNRELAQRKASEQESIDALLQQCRTSARGLGASQPHSTPQPSRPKSQQMNLVGSSRAGSAGPGKSGLYHTLNGPLEVRREENGSLSARHRSPLASNNLRLLRTDPASMQEHSELGGGRPGSAQGVPLYSDPNGPGFHSLDRKRHLVGYYSETETRGRMTGQQHLYAHTSATLAAMVSPRRYPVPKPNLSLPMQTEDSNWRHSSADGRDGSQSARSMSRSMIEHSPSLTRKARRPEAKASPSTAHSLRISPQDPTVCLDYPANNNTLGPPPLHVRNGRGSRSVSGDARSENIYANLIQRTSAVMGEEPPSPNLHCRSEAGFPVSPGSSAGGRALSVGGVPRDSGAYLTAVLGRVGEEAGLGDSQLSLASNSSSYYAAGGDKYESEMRKLQREVEGYKDRIRNLHDQQSSYTSIVQSFETALERMARKIQELSVDKHRKDKEVEDLRRHLREMSVDAGFGTPRKMASNSATPGPGVTSQGVVAPPSPSVSRRHTFNNQQGNGNGAAVNGNGQNGALGHRQGSSESLVSSVSQRSSLSTNSSKGSKGEKNSTSSGGSKDSKDTASNGLSKHPKRSWIRSSFSRAFKGGAGAKGVPNGAGKKGWMSDVEEASREESPSGPPNSARSVKEPSPGAKSAGAADPEAVVSALRNELRERESVLTDARLDALTSRQQLDELRQKLHKMENENSLLKAELTRGRGLHSQGGSQSSLLNNDELHQDGTQSDYGPCRRLRPSPAHSLHVKSSGLRVWLLRDLSGLPEALEQLDGRQRLLLGRLPIPAQLSWPHFESLLAQLFNEYVHRIDPVANLDLNFCDSVLGYRLAERCLRHPLDPGNDGGPLSLTPDELEAGVTILLRGVAEERTDALALESLVPRSFLMRQLHILSEHRRAFIAGAPGVGKATLARHLGSQLALRAGPGGRMEVLKVGSGPTAAADLRKCLAPLLGESSPAVVVVEGLERLSGPDMGSVLRLLPDASAGQGPVVIGTLADARQYKLQLHHDFRMILLTPQSEPVRGLLSRFLQRRLLEAEAEAGIPQRTSLLQVLDWLPKLWDKINEALEAGGGTAIGPEDLLACPLSVGGSREWLVELWNKEVQPRLARAARESGSAMAAMETRNWVLETWPWEDLATADDEDPLNPEMALKAFPVKAVPPPRSSSQPKGQAGLIRVNGGGESVAI